MTGLADIPKLRTPDYPEVEARKHLSPKQKAELCLKQGGKCAGCQKKPIHGWEFDHVDALWASGSNALDNWQAFGSRKDCKCHRIKTGEEAKHRAKMNRCRGKAGQLRRRKVRGGSSIKSNPKIVSPGVPSSRGMGRPAVSALSKHHPGYRKPAWGKR